MFAPDGYLHGCGYQQKNSLDLTIVCLGREVDSGKAQVLFIPQAKEKKIIQSFLNKTFLFLTPNQKCEGNAEGGRGLPFIANVIYT